MKKIRMKRVEDQRKRREGRVEEEMTKRTEGRVEEQERKRREEKYRNK